jgi:hypothetical protein
MVWGIVKDIQGFAKVGLKEVKKQVDLMKDGKKAESKANESEKAAFEKYEASKLKYDPKTKKWVSTKWKSVKGFTDNEKTKFWDVIVARKVVKDLKSKDAKIRKAALKDLKTMVKGIRAGVIHNREVIKFVLKIDPARSKSDDQEIENEFNGIDTPMVAVSTVDSNAPEADLEVQRDEVAAAADSTDRAAESMEALQKRLDAFAERLDSADPKAKWIHSLAERMEKHSREKMIRPLERMARSAGELGKKESELQARMLKGLREAKTSKEFIARYKKASFYAWSGAVLTMIKKVRTAHKAVLKAYDSQEKNMKILSFGIFNWIAPHLWKGIRLSGMGSLDLAEKNVLKARKMFAKVNGKQFKRLIRRAEMQFKWAIKSYESDREFLIDGGAIITRGAIAFIERPLKKF